MIEEYIQGESLETFVSHQKSISEELIVKLGIQLCDIFTYLHHLSPYPILYQDLKPEHIILCGDQVKLLDFGIASFFTGFGKNFQLYGTSRYCAPEILRGQPVTPAADIYSLGRVLTELSDAMSCRCSRQLRCILEQACAADPADRCQEACDLKAAMLRVPLSAVFASHSEHCRHREQTRCRRHAYFHFSCQHHESKTYSRHLYCRGRARIASTRRQGKSSSDRPERDLYLWKLPRDSGLWGQYICFRSAG